MHLVLFCLNPKFVVPALVGPVMHATIGLVYSYISSALDYFPMPPSTLHYP